MENVTRRTVQTGRKRFATLRANILQIPMSTANGLGLKVSETLHLKNHRILQFLFVSLAGIKFL